MQPLNPQQWWRVSTRVSIKPLDQAAVGAVSTLPEAENLPESNLTAVVLPSCNVFLCSSAVLARSSRLLHAQEGRLGPEAVHLEFAPAEEFPDEMVVAFLSRLHEAVVNRKDSFPLADWAPEWCILVTALDIRELVNAGQRALDSAVNACSEFWRWMRVRLHSLGGDDATWRNEVLQLLSDVPDEDIPMILNEGTQDLVLGMLTEDELFSVAYVRFTTDPNSTGMHAAASDDGSQRHRARKVQRTQPDFSIAAAINAITFTNPENPADADANLPSSSIFTLPDVPSTPFAIRPAARPSAGTTTIPEERTMVVARAENLPRHLQLRLVINYYLTIVVDADFMLMQSPFLAQAFVEIDDPDTPLEMPLLDTAGMDDGDVLEFFNVIHEDSSLKRTAQDKWKFTWVQMASFLQMTSLSAKLADWVWKANPDKLGGNFWQWVTTTRLHAMQQAKPPQAPRTTEAEEVIEILRMMPREKMAECVVDYRAGFRKVLGLPALYKLLEVPHVAKPKPGKK